MFARLTKNLTQELDSDGRLIPVSSLASVDSYRLFCLVMKEQSRLPLKPRKYLATPYTLSDVLKEGTTLDAEVKYEDLLLYSKIVEHEAGGKLGLNLQPTEVDFGGSGKSSFSISLTSVRKTCIVKKEEWKIDISHKFIKEFSDSPRKLYVVTEAFDLKEPLLVEKMTQAGGKAVIRAWEIGGIKGRGKSVKKKTMLIPQGTVLAYVVQPLNIQKEKILCVCNCSRNMKSSFVYDGFQSEPASSLTGFQNVKGAIEKECKQLMYLSQDFKIKLLGTFKSFLQDGDVISTVKTVLELFLAGGLPKPSMMDLLDEILRPQVENLLNDLGVYAGEKEEARALWRLVHFLCSSLEDLDYETLPLLKTCLEENMVAKQLELMDGILEWILSSDKESVFILPSSLTEEMNLTAEMLCSCGLTLQSDRPSLACLWNKAAQSHLTALYAALYAFWMLS
ncbi:gasdermin-A2-like [Carettochelys insculpta]|uniref:gasdermin-A2-like n=1 Tax=Carettochelys insculpta TaxID=44489 RepID=UPI003EBC3B61